MPGRSGPDEDLEAPAVGHVPVGELSTLSPEFRSQWAAHNVRIHHDGTKRLRHPRSAAWS
ncbi:hypothetical protein GCM10027187_22650 [Streptosporangium sandarakinum]|uniref:MmyB-like transcription regulator ligand binding domain-containing protein n=1 Tax=Streptosporangium sandarakinum TaxID=1260955 RepID=A0A852V6Q9_9ACTN|nr:hypothetical protein [Streptosporangium sandarakinum]NYF41695.1 hypothetical protein [Streptosporangium sandarakinum]